MPRRSTRVKRSVAKKYTYELSSDEGDDAQTPEVPRDDQGKEETAEEEEEEEEENEEDLELSSSSADEAAAFQRGSTSPPPRGKSAKTSLDYLDIELAPPEGQHKGYVGPCDRSMRGKALLRAWYGPQKDEVEMAHDLLERWRGWTVLPPKALHQGPEPTAEAMESEKRLAGEWWARTKQSLSANGAWEELGAEELPYYRMPQRSMPALLGQHDAQQEVVFETGACYSLSSNGLPYDGDDDPSKTTSGWMLDVGGVVLGMDWAPRRHKDLKQLLAMAVIPHSDQELYNFEEASMDPNFQRHGTVQLWQFPGTKTARDDGVVRPSSENAACLRTLCFECGRVTRVNWSPTCSHLAVLCGDGSVCVVDVEHLLKDSPGGYCKVKRPLATLRLLDEYSIKATAVAWINCNRLAVGYSDGSIALWSIYPCRLLSRHPVHHNHVVDMVSGYPALPNLIASLPLGGTLRLIDIRAPSYEATEVQKPLIHTQPGMLVYSNPMQGFISTYPSASALNTVVGFLHHAHFPVARRVFTGDSYITCLATGRLHPFLLVGAADGSVWSLNAQTEVFSNRHEATEKIRVFQHEHRSAALFPPNTPASARGASRILQGFGVERSRNGKAETKATTKKGGRLIMPRIATNAAEEDDEAADLTDPSRAVLHDPLTRITAMEWNPNEDYGCWAAIAMGSGLVRIVDLGLEREDRSD